LFFPDIEDVKACSLDAVTTPDAAGDFIIA